MSRAFPALLQFDLYSRRAVVKFKGQAITKRHMSRSTRSLVGTVLLLSPIFLGAQDSLADRLAPAARAAIAKAPTLGLERAVVEVQVPPNWELGRISAAAIGRDGSVFVLHRGAKADPVVVIDSNGRVLRSWGKGLFKIPHS